MEIQDHPSQGMLFMTYGKPPYMKILNWRFQQKLHSGNRFRKPALMVAENVLYVWGEVLNEG